MFGTDKTRQFQQGLDPLSLRRGREADRLNLRRKKREEVLQRKRRQIMSGGLLNDANSKNQLCSIGTVNIKNVSLSSLSAYISQMASNNIEEQINGLISVRVLLSQPDNPPTNEILEADVLPILLNFFTRNDNEKLQFEAAWAVTNLCSNSIICQKICTNGSNTIKYFSTLLKTSKHHEIMDQAVWGLGNIAGENEYCKNAVLKEGVFPFLINKIEQFAQSNYDLCRNAIWCISNLVRCGDKKHVKNLCPWSQLSSIFVVFNRLLNDLGGRLKKYRIEISGGKLEQDDITYNSVLQCVIDCIWAIQYTTVYVELEPNSSYINDLFSTNIVSMLVYFMQMDSVTLTSPSLRVLGTLISGPDDVTRKVLEKGYLKSAMLNLGCKVRNIRKEICWTLSNIAAAENKQLIITVIEYEQGGLLKMIINSCIYDDDQVKNEAGWVLANIIQTHDDKIIHFLVEKGVINALKFVMKCASVKKPLITCIEAFDIICSKTKCRDNGPYDYISKVEESGAVEIFDILQAGVDTDDNVYNAASNVVAKYWPEEHNDNTSFITSDNMLTMGNNHNDNHNGDANIGNNHLNPQQSSDGRFAFGYNMNSSNNNNNHDDIDDDDTYQF